MTSGTIFRSKGNGADSGRIAGHFRYAVRTVARKPSYGSYGTSVANVLSEGSLAIVL